MRKESIGIMLLSASATCAVMLGLLVPLGVTAESEGGEIGEPAIEINGCRLSVRVVDYAVGKPVRLRVTSSTHTESVKSVPVHLEMEVEDLESRMSRVLTPREASVNWRYDGEIKCSEEKNTLELAADGKLGGKHV
ncbi:MAG TPA: hypothetical protein PLP17_02975, partial [Oligoflexia bacterium]|nr:hypothetical protein [Oligoflexia bacterium]